MAFKFDDAVILFIFFLSLLPFVLIGFIVYGIYFVVKNIVLPIYDEVDSIFDTIKNFIKSGIQEVVDVLDSLSAFETTVENFIRDKLNHIFSII